MARRQSRKPKPRLPLLYKPAGPRLRHDEAVPADGTFSRLLADVALACDIERIAPGRTGAAKIERQAWAHLGAYLSAKAFAKP